MIINHWTTLRVAIALALVTFPFYFCAIVNVPIIGVFVAVVGAIFGARLTRSTSTIRIEDCFVEPDGFQKYLNNPDQLSYKGDDT